MISRVQGHQPLKFPRFTGEKEYQQYLGMLREFSPKGIDMVALIKRHEKDEGAKHIAIAMGLGVIDTQVKQLNKVIVDLIRQRNKNKTKDPALHNQAKEFLGDLRNAITQVLSENGYDEKGHKQQQP
jgi:hypothetical protein